MNADVMKACMGLKLTQSIDQSSYWGKCIFQSELDSNIGPYLHSKILLVVRLDAMIYTHTQTNIQSLILVVS